MSITASRTVQIQYSGDMSSQIINSALDNTTAFGETDTDTLTIGANTITAPVVSGLTISGLTIIPPPGNVNLIILKGVTGDTGVPLHKTDPTSIALDSTFVSLVLTVTVAVVGVRLIWT
jgi:hypothetical protein